MHPLKQEFEQPSELSLSAMDEGVQCEALYTISRKVYEGYIHLFEDRSPVHTDEIHAKKRGFTSRVMHGGILNGFLSHFVGMRFPGKNALLLSSDISYIKPCYLGDSLILRGVVAQKNESLGVLSLECTFYRGEEKVARAVVKVKVYA